MNSEIQLEDLRRLLVENCMLKVDPSIIQEDTPLFGPNSLGLDSIDVLQLTVGIEATYNTPIPNAEVALQVLKTPRTIRQWIERQLNTSP